MGLNFSFLCPRSSENEDLFMCCNRGSLAFTLSLPLLFVNYSPSAYLIQCVIFLNNDCTIVLLFPTSSKLFNCMGFCSCQYFPSTGITFLFITGEFLTKSLRQQDGGRTPSHEYITGDLIDVYHTSGEMQLERSLHGYNRNMAKPLSARLPG